MRRFSSYLGKVHGHTEAKEEWTDQLQYFQRSNGYNESFGIDGEPIEFEWNNFPGHTTLEILQEIQDRMTVCQTSPEEFEDRIIFMSMFTDTDWTKKGNYNECFLNSVKIKNYAKRFQLGH